MPNARSTDISENRGWLSIHALLGADSGASVGVLGAPLGLESITPGRCDLAPGVVRAALKRMSVYDLETGTDLSSLKLFDAGDLDISGNTPAEAFASLRDGVAEQTGHRALTILLGGNNAITRGGVHGTDPLLKTVGVLTIDAHFDLRDTDGGLNNGNPIQALLEDGLPGRHISQIGLAPFANTRKAHDKALSAGIRVHTLGDCHARGIVTLAREELERLSKLCDAIYVDFDIDAIDRVQMPSAPGARPGGLLARDFLSAARLIAAHPKVRCVDLAEFDPSLDVADTGALIAARWVAEILAGFATRR
jgi:formiminoglutamase